MSFILKIEYRQDLKELIDVLQKLRKEGKVLIAIVFGSFAKGEVHSRSDIDLAIYLNRTTTDEETEIIDRILMATDRNIHMLRLDDEEESPFIVQEALKGIHLVEPDWETYYQLARRTLHEAEGIRFRRSLSGGQLAKYCCCKE